MIYFGLFRSFLSLFSFCKPSTLFYTSPSTYIVSVEYFVEMIKCYNNVSSLGYTNLMLSSFPWSNGRTQPPFNHGLGWAVLKSYRKTGIYNFRKKLQWHYFIYFIHQLVTCITFFNQHLSNRLCINTWNLDLCIIY